MLKHPLQHSELCIKTINQVCWLLLIGLLVTLLGISAYTFVYDGSPFHKYITSKDSVERVHDKEVGELSADYLFGDKEVDLTRVEELSHETVKGIEESYAWLEKVSEMERWFLVILISSMLLVLFFYTKIQQNPALSAVFLVAGIYICLQAFAIVQNGGKGFSDLAIGAHATRYTLAILLIGYIFLPRFNQEQKTLYQKALFLIGVLACSATFAVHGWEAYHQHAGFVDLIIGSAYLLNLHPPQSLVTKLLVVIGIMDMVLATMVILYPTKKLLYWMAIWGFITALSRPLSMGISSWHETAIRAGNFVLPLCLAILLSTGLYWKPLKIFEKE
jgi:hypothetical protein